MMKSFYAVYNAWQHKTRAVFVHSKPMRKALYARLYGLDGIYTEAQTTCETEDTDADPDMF